MKSFDFKRVSVVDEDVRVQVVSFSGEKQLEDQLYSIFSFLANVGRPGKWILFSDGTHSKESMAIFDKMPFIEFRENGEDLIPGKYREEKNPLLKKVFFYQSVPITSTTFFVDSDILFFKSFKLFLPILNQNNWFLVDENYGYLDKAFLEKNPFDIYPCNSGFFVFNSRPDWETVLNYLAAKKEHKDGLELWSEQTAFHIMTRQFKNTMPLDPRYFVAGGTDSFKFSSDYDYSKIAMRHFVGPIRHKMWQTDWRKLLKVRN